MGGGFWDFEKFVVEIDLGFSRFGLVDSECPIGFWRRDFGTLSCHIVQNCLKNGMV